MAVCDFYRVTEVTLKDFKDVFSRHGNFRFFFKTEDPDCGVVKAEVTVFITSAF